MQTIAEVICTAPAILLHKQMQSWALNCFSWKVFWLVHALLLGFLIAEIDSGEKRGTLPKLKRGTMAPPQRNIIHVEWIIKFQLESLSFTCYICICIWTTASKLHIFKIRKAVTVQNCNFEPVGSASENTWTPSHCTNKQHQRLKGRFQKGVIKNYALNSIPVRVSWITLIQPQTLARHHWQPLGTWTTVMFSSAFASGWKGMRVRLPNGWGRGEANLWTRKTGKKRLFQDDLKSDLLPIWVRCGNMKVQLMCGWDIVLISSIIFVTWYLLFHVRFQHSLCGSLVKSLS